MIMLGILLVMADITLLMLLRRLMRMLLGRLGTVLLEGMDGYSLADGEQSIKYLFCCEKKKT